MGFLLFKEMGFCSLMGFVVEERLLSIGWSLDFGYLFTNQSRLL